MSAAELRSGAQLEVKNPFPGLRPFDVHESELFCGREDEVPELLSRLRRTHFQAVVGSSGCGKSSVVRAGLVASLQDGFMAEPTAPWRIAIMRPGNNPVAQLALALNADEAFGCTGSDPEDSAAMRQAALRRGALGLVELYEEANLPPGSKVLVLVDQFEELFRFMRESSGASQLAQVVEKGTNQSAVELRRSSLTDEAQAFVKLLLVAADSNLPIYVVLTMRSEFLGHCANFPGLPEAINRGLYLLPKMSREQLRDAIEGPVEAGGGQIAPRLVNRLLNDLSDADQLPILQHAMMRMWSEWSPNRQSGPIDLEHYKNIGELHASLSAHAEETYESLTESQKEVAELLFRTITETTEDQQTVRHPAEFFVVCQIVRNARKQDAPRVEESSTVEQEVTSVVNKFREEGRSFLMPPADRPLQDHTVIDISHESLIRQWNRLREWAEKEARFTKIRRRLKGAAEEWQEKNWSDATLLYTGARLLEAVEYAKDRGTTLTPLEHDFIETSEVMGEAERTRKLEEAKREAKSRFQRRMVFVLIIAFLASSAALIFAVAQFSAARSAQQKAEEAQQKAEEAEKQVRVESGLAKDRLKEALKAYGYTDAQLANLEGNQEIVQESVDANDRLQQISGTSLASDKERRKSILVTYYRKDAERLVMEGVLPVLGFQVQAVRSDIDVPTNAIWVNPEVIDNGVIKLEDVKLVAYALIRSGIQIRRIGPPSLKNADWRTGVSTTWRTNREPHIWIGSNATYDNKPALTVEQVQRASAFREEQ
jgi:hypothetical protein